MIDLTANYAGMTAQALHFFQSARLIHAWLETAHTTTNSVIRSLKKSITPRRIFTVFSAAAIEFACPVAVPTHVNVSHSKTFVHQHQHAAARNKTQKAQAHVAHHAATETPNPFLSMLDASPAAQKQLDAIGNQLTHKYGRNDANARKLFNNAFVAANKSALVTQAKTNDPETIIAARVAIAQQNVQIQVAQKVKQLSDKVARLRHLYHVQHYAHEALMPLNEAKNILTAAKYEQANIASLMTQIGTAVAPTDRAEKIVASVTHNVRVESAASAYQNAVASYPLPVANVSLASYSLVESATRNWAPYVVRATSDQGVSASYSLAQMSEESGGNPNAVNQGSGCTGLGQFDVGTGREYGLIETDGGKTVDMRKDPLLSIQAQAHYNHWLHSKFAGNYAKMGAAYNIGPSFVEGAEAAADNAGKPNAWISYLPTHSSYGNVQQTALSYLKGLNARGAFSEFGPSQNYTLAMNAYYGTIKSVIRPAEGASRKTHSKLGL